MFTLPPAADGSTRVERLRLLEELKAAACAEQMRLAVALDAEVRDDERAAGVPAARRGRGVAAQLGLALRRSPHAAQHWLWHAKTLTADLPRVLAELGAGRTTEWRALIVARETSVLPAEQRRIVDARISPVLESSGDRQVETAARTLAQTLDPDAAVRRARRAAGDRRVTIRPVADAMARVSILAAVAQGVAAYAALSRAASIATAVPGGDPRGRGQLMADTAIELLTGQATASAVPVTIDLVVPADTLLADGPGRDTPALLLGAAGPTPVPAGIARDLALRGDAARWLRRLFTALVNGRGLCAACNQAAASPGWRARVGPDGDITCTTPTGHSYLSPEPRPPGPLPAVVERQRDLGPIEITYLGHAA